VPPLLSVLLPTRNRLEFLTLALETVRRQDDGDWEIVVSDNDSEQDIAGHLAALGDERIRYVRTDSFVPVTDNWNNALAHATGRYVVMLGDDDGLMPGYVSALRGLTARFGDPDVVYCGAWLYAYPDVMPDEPAGYLQPYGYARFLRGRSGPFVLSPAVARRMVKHAMHFRVRYGFNMQFSAISRRLLDELAPRGPFFQSAFPDYYATNVSFLTARRIVVEPRPMVVIGITPKSYGFFHAHAQEEAAQAFLGAVSDETARERLEAALLPGSNIYAGWLSALESIWARYRDVAPAAPDHRRFRLLQAVYVYAGHHLEGTVAAEQVAQLEEHLRGWERRLGRAAVRIVAAARAPLPPLARRAFAFAFNNSVMRQTPRWDPPKIRGRYRTLLDVYESPPAS
jgi:glycosyltransferase involved in cell wall biosynthesis